MFYTKGFTHPFIIRRKVMKDDKAKTKVKTITPAPPKDKTTEPIPPKDKTPKPKKKENVLVLPRYMKLAKGGMWKDTEGESSSGAIVYALDKVMVGRNPKDKDSQPAVDKFDNQNLVEYGFIDKKMQWYIYLTDIPKENLGRIIIAYKSGVLERANPKTPPVAKPVAQKSDWKIKKDGDLIFDGKNKEMFTKLQNLKFNKLKEFVEGCPINAHGQDNLTDLLDYEKRGFNWVSRPRLEVLDLIRCKLREYGPGMTGIRRNELTEK